MSTLFCGNYKDMSHNLLQLLSGTVHLLSLRTTFLPIASSSFLVLVTFENERQSTLANSLQFMLKIKQICNCFLHDCLASFLKQDGGVNFGNDRLSVVTALIGWQSYVAVSFFCALIGFEDILLLTQLNLTTFTRDGNIFTASLQMFCSRYKNCQLRRLHWNQLVL